MSAAGALWVRRPTETYVTPRRRNRADCIKPHAARGLARHPAGNQRNRFAQLSEAHVVEQDVAGTGCQRGLDLGDRVDLADDALHPRRFGTSHRFADAASDEYMVVLDHRGVPQPHAVVLRAAHPGRVFFEMAQAGDGFAGIEQRRISGHRIDIAARHRRDARKVLRGVERAAFGGQHGAGIAAEAHQVAAGGD